MPRRAGCALMSWRIQIGPSSTSTQRVSPRVARIGSPMLGVEPETGWKPLATPGSAAGCSFGNAWGPGQRRASKSTTTAAALAANGTAAHQPGRHQAAGHRNTTTGPSAHRGHPPAQWNPRGHRSRPVHSATPPNGRHGVSRGRRTRPQNRRAHAPPFLEPWHRHPRCRPPGRATCCSYPACRGAGPRCPWTGPPGSPSSSPRPPWSNATRCRASPLRGSGS